jgi:nucleotide-binding universal stress UspA family protein
MRNIVAIDDSPYSAQVVAAIAARRWPAGSEFKVLSVVEPLEALEIAEEDDIESATHRNRRKAAERMCAEARQMLQTAVPDAIIHFEVREGRPVLQIIGAAVDWSADRILIGAHGRDVCPHNLLGSVSRAVAHEAPCTVEVVRPRSLARAK